MNFQSIIKKSNNWLEFKDKLKQLTPKEKGDAFERLTKQYLQFDPKYATKLKRVWLYNEIPSFVVKKLNLPSRDQGIDLVAETREGEFWAIQCKYLEDETKSLSWRTLATFTGLAFGVCRNISYGLVCTTAERFTTVLKEQYNIGFCTGEVWRNLNEDFFKLFRSRKPKAIKPLKPYAHQKRAIQSAYDYYINKKASRGKMIMPCGTGKSLSVFWIAEKLDAKRIVVAVPSLALIRQTLKVWLRETYAKKWDVDWICVCSDESVGKVSRDDLVVLKQDLGVPSVTDPETIAKWLRKRHSGKVVVFTTYQSGKALAEASRLARRNFDLGVMDEAHKTVGTKDKTFAHLLFDEKIKIRKRLFMTATERRYAGKRDEIISMDDYDVYGETFEMLSFKEALEQDTPVLSDYKIVTMMIGKDEIADLVQRGAFVRPTRGKWDSEVEADTLASLIALRKAVRKFNIRHAVSFHSSIARAEAFRDNQPIFTDLFPNLWNVESYHVSGKMPTSRRDRHMQDFENSKRALMTNARCLTEGIDIPDIDCVLFADPKKSTIDIVQAVGRALRVSEGKRYGYVIVPVLVTEESEKFVETEAFSAILMTLRALASDDERIIEYFRAMSQKRRSGNTIQIEIDERLAEKIDIKNFVENLELKVWSRLAKLSWRPFEEAREIVKKLEFKSRTHYVDNYEEFVPEDIPKAPDLSYVGHGWTDWADFLGTTRISYMKRERWTYEQHKDFIQKQGLKSTDEYKAFLRGELFGKDLVPPEYFTNPDKAFPNDFPGWAAYLGYEGRRHGKWKPFKNARSFARSLGLERVSDWRTKFLKGKIKKCPKRPHNIPAKPDKVYHGDFIDYYDWVGIAPTARSKSRDVYWEYEKAKTFLKLFSFPSKRQYSLWAAGKHKDSTLPPKPVELPFDAEVVYSHPSRNSWISWPDFLGYEPKRKKK